MRTVRLHTFEEDMMMCRPDFATKVQFDVFKKCYYQLLITRENIKAILRSLASIERLLSCNEEQCEVFADQLAHIMYFIFQKRQDLELMKRRFSNALKRRTNKTQQMKEKLLNAVAKIQKIVDEKQKKVDEIHKNRYQKKIHLDQMKAVVNGSEDESQVVEKEGEMSTLNFDLTFSTTKEHSTSTNDLMEKYFQVRKTLEERKASCLQKAAARDQLMHELIDAETKLEELRMSKIESHKIIPHRNQSDFTLNQSAWNF